MKKEYINYRIIADKELLEFLRSDEEDRFSKMDALCDLLDKASGENRDSLAYFGTVVTLRKGSSSRPSATLPDNGNGIVPRHAVSSMRWRTSAWRG